MYVPTETGCGGRSFYRVRWRDRGGYLRQRKFPGTPSGLRQALGFQRGRQLGADSRLDLVSQNVTLVVGSENK